MGWLSKFFQAIKGTDERRENCKKLSNLTGLSWSYSSLGDPHGSSISHYYFSPQDSHPKVEKVTEVLNRAIYGGEKVFVASAGPQIRLWESDFESKKRQKFSVENLKKEICDKISEAETADRQMKHQSLAGF